MNNEVNLIANRKKSTAEKEKLIKLIRIIAYISLGIVVVLSVILFFLNQDTSFTQLSSKEKTTLAGLTLSNKKIAKFLVSKSRLKEINGVLAKRSSYEVVISDIAMGIPSSVSIDTFSLTKQSVSMTVSSTSLSAVNTLLSYLVDTLNTKKTFKSISINGVSADLKNGKYSLILDAKFL